MKGFTLLEMIVSVLIILLLISVAVPYYFNAAESARITEIVVLWGQQKNFVTGRNLTPQEADKATERLQNSKLKYFTGRVYCRAKDNADEYCWEAEFTQKDTNSHARYILLTTDNFKHLNCQPINSAGKSFCQSQAHEENPFSLDGKDTYWVR